MVNKIARFAAGCTTLLIVSVAAVPATAADDSAFQATVQVVEGASPSTQCGISSDGRWVVGSAASDLDGVVLHDLSSGLHTTILATGRADFMHLSEDGRFVTYASTNDPRGTQGYQYDRETGQSVELANSPSYITNLRVSSDGDLVSWTEQSITERPAQSPELGPAHTWIWRRTTNQRVEVTRNPAGANPSTPFPNKLRPWIVDADGGHKMWFPTTGNELDVTPPEGMNTSDIEAVSNDGQRILYARSTGNDQPFYRSLVVTTRGGSVIAEQTKRIGREFGQVRYWLTGDGSKVFANGFDSIAHPDQPLHIIDLQPYQLIWDIGTNTTQEILAVGVGIGGYCAGSDDLRWLVATLGHPISGQMARIDTHTEVPTAVDAAVLEGSQLSDQIHRLYRAYFGRDADAPGLSFWLASRASGTPLINASNSFANSPEFRATYGDLNTGEFITLVYDNVLDRSPDQVGFDHWVNEINIGMTRGELMLAFSESPEFVDRTGTSTPVTELRLPQIHRMYRAFLLRDADSEGLSYWNHQLGRGKTLEDIAAGFVNSPEFVSQYGELNDDAYIELVYNNVLDRSPDATGSSFWLTRLQSGMGRGAMMTAFSESPEFIIVTNTLPPTA